MEEIGVRELKENASEVLRRVREVGESYTITYRGRAIARIVPADTEAEDMADWEKIWAEMDETAAEITKKWPRGVTAVEAVREQRREL